MGKLVSILVPTRKRPHGCKMVIDSVVESASDLSKVELLFRVDDDDIVTQQFFESEVDIPEGLDVSIVTGDRYLNVNKNGYHNIHRFYAELAAESTGEFLFIFNDDLNFQQINFDGILQEHSGKTCVINPNWEHYSTAFYTFPIISRNIFEATGTMGNVCTIDRWFTAVALTLNIGIQELRIVLAHLGDAERRTLGNTEGQFPSIHILEGHQDPLTLPSIPDLEVYIAILRDKLGL